MLKHLKLELLNTHTHTGQPSDVLIGRDKHLWTSHLGAAVSMETKVGGADDKVFCDTPLATVRTGASSWITTGLAEWLL